MSAGFIVQTGIPPKPIAETWVTIVTGNDARLKNGGGNFPAVALWDDYGNRIAQYLPELDEKVSQGSETTVKIPHDQVNGQLADPHYVMLSNGRDATCIAMVQVSNGQLSGTFYGDTGYKCGQSWYYSYRKLNENHLTTRCVWLDADHSSKNSNARSLSFHVRDMIPSHDKLKLYNSHWSYLCGSTPRFSFWKRLLPDGTIPFFLPPLKYNKDSLNSRREGTDEDPFNAIDRIQYDKNVYMKQGEPEKAYRRNNRPYSSLLSKRQGANMDPEHLVMTELPGQTAQEVCEDLNAVGYDIVSFVDMKYCDLSERKLYDLCSTVIRHNCFDANNTAFVGDGVVQARGEYPVGGGAKKSYKTRDIWK